MYTMDMPHAGIATCTYTFFYKSIYYIGNIKLAYVTLLEVLHGLGATFRKYM